MSIPAERNTRGARTGGSGLRTRATDSPRERGKTPRTGQNRPNPAIAVRAHPSTPNKGGQDRTRSLAVRAARVPFDI